LLFLDWFLEEFFDFGEVGFHEGADGGVGGGVAGVEGGDEFITAEIKRPTVDVI